MRIKSTSTRKRSEAWRELTVIVEQDGRASQRLQYRYLVKTDGSHRFRRESATYLNGRAVPDGRIADLDERDLAEWLTREGWLDLGRDASAADSERAIHSRRTRQGPPRFSIAETTDAMSDVAHDHVAMSLATDKGFPAVYAAKVARRI